jgi:cytochrome-b5 reductase
VKRYETGVISKYLHDQCVGDTVLMSGPALTRAAIGSMA